MVPLLETPRLTLRGHTRADLPAVAALWADPVVTQHIGGRAFSAEESWWKILRYVGHWSLMAYGYWVVEDRASGRFVGEVGFADFQRELTPSFEGAPEAGWVLAPWAHGRGLATEALLAALAWMDARGQEPSRTVCMIDPGNTASIRVAEKAGYREWARSDYKGTPAVLFERK